jgi:hypothetical protein
MAVIAEFWRDEGRLAKPGVVVLIPEEAAPQFRDDCAPL